MYARGWSDACDTAGVVHGARGSGTPSLKNRDSSCREKAELVPPVLHAAKAYLFFMRCVSLVFCFLLPRNARTPGESDTRVGRPEAWVVCACSAIFFAGPSYSPYRSPLPSISLPCIAIQNLNLIHFLFRIVAPRDTKPTSSESSTLTETLKAYTSFKPRNTQTQAINPTPYTMNPTPFARNPKS